MAELLRENEAIPASFPPVPTGLSTPAAALNSDMLWARIEAYTRTRYTSREVVWLLDGTEDDEWTPPLSPLMAHAAEIWVGGEWQDADTTNGPLGLCLPSNGVFKVTGMVGDGDPPAAVNEAFRRLSEYMADESDRAGVSSYSVNMGGAIQESYQRSAAHAARALQNSGAADLLRPYRRQK